MTIRARHYRHPDDFEKVGQFLVRTYQTEGTHINWLQPRWEYMHFLHPYLDESSLERIGVWEDDQEIVGAIHHEHRLGTVYVQIHPAYSFLKGEMLEYAVGNLAAEADGGRLLRVYINEADDELRAIAGRMGFEKAPKSFEHMSRLVIADSFPAVKAPEGFRLRSLHDNNDLRKVNRALHRGFNHPGEPPEEGIESQRKMQAAPNFRKDLTIVAEAPNGDFVSYCGMWYEPTNRFAYVEPVATDPDYRRRGLGTAVVLEGVRRCGQLGATVAYVGTAKPFYKSMGFREMYVQFIWKKAFTATAALGS